jgi:DNA-binding MarR family transcriptional regulator
LPGKFYIGSESNVLSLKRQFLDHLAEVTGSVPDLLAAKVAGLPLFLRERYQFARTRLFGQSILLALEQGNPESATPGEYEKHADTLRSQSGEPVVLVLPALPAYIRNRMVRCGLPFIVPGSQIFLPTALIDLRERFRQPIPKAGKPLTPAAQCVLLYHLQRQPLENMPLREIAERIGYSPVMLTKVKTELLAAELCEPKRIGRSVALHFTTGRRQLWDAARPLLSSPVAKTVWIQGEKPGHPALQAGLTALSRRTMIADDRLPTFALLSEVFQANLERGLFRGCPGPEDADLKMEVWAYNPQLFADNGSVDPLSLFLSLHDFPDERVQQQLELLINEFPW